ncbi:uncharacterized protein EAF01_007658 [Botrytis porri]|uniref:uncharacterized protein n=1 Tax=Botrytis porri TaxID=87229 RepID=UPI0019013EDC|nr:uncharacterized protein EAF01_007658 [Botrytis porri]KAF7900356.1 hypothetical protein EAF01_007658 [Botrytis porri]
MSTESPPPESPPTDPLPSEFLYGFKYCPHKIAHGNTCGIYHSGLGSGNRSTCACPPGLRSEGSVSKTSLSGV